MTAPVAPRPGGLAETLNILLDKGLVIEATIRVSVIGIELLTIEVRIVIASVDTYLRYLEAMQRLEAAQRATNAAFASPVAGQGIAGTYGLLTTPIPPVQPVQHPAAEEER